MKKEKKKPGLLHPDQLHGDVHVLQVKLKGKKHFIELLVQRDHEAGTVLPLLKHYRVVITGEVRSATAHITVLVKLGRDEGTMQIVGNANVTTVQIVQLVAELNQSVPLDTWELGVLISTLRMQIALLQPVRPTP